MAAYKLFGSIPGSDMCRHRSSILLSDSPLLADSGYHQSPLSAILRTQHSYLHAISSLFILQVICVHVSKLSLSVAILICLNLGYCYPALFE